MRGALINLAEGMLPLVPFPFGTNYEQTLQEAMYWLWRVRTVEVRMDITVVGEDENGDPVIVIDIHRSVVLTVPLGSGTTGSRTEADQLLSRRGYVIDEIDEDGVHIIFSFAGSLRPASGGLWSVGLGFTMSQSGLSLIGGDPTFLPVGTLTSSGEDLVLGAIYEHELTLMGRQGVTAVVSVVPVRFQEWALNGVPLYDSLTGALLP